MADETVRMKIIKTVTRTRKASGAVVGIDKTTLYRQAIGSFSPLVGEEVTESELNSRTVTITTDLYEDITFHVCNGDSTGLVPSVPSYQALKNKVVGTPTIFTVDVDESRSDASGNAYATNTVYIKFPDGSIVPMGGEKEPDS